MALDRLFRRLAPISVAALALVSCGEEEPRARWMNASAVAPTGGEGAESPAPTTAGGCDEVFFIANFWAGLANDFAIDLEAGLTEEAVEHYRTSIGQGLADSRPLVDSMAVPSEPELARLGARLGGDLDAVAAAESAEAALERIGYLLDTLDEVLVGCGWSPAVSTGEPGAITVSYEETADFDGLARSLAGSGIFEGMAETVTSVVALPTDLPIVFAECDTPNAYYWNGSITMCYELVDLLVDVFVEYFEDPVEIQEAVFGSAAFIYLHEIGHALVHELQIPVTGREEDSVDTLAALILLLGGSTDALLATTQQFAALSAAWEGDGELAFWDEHSLFAQRQYDVACLIYGSDPETWAHLVGPDLLPEPRAVRCPAEFAQKSLAWDRLLAPHYRQ